MFTATTLRCTQLVDIGSNASKVVISMPTTKNAMVPKKFHNKELEEVILIHVTFEELSATLGVDRSIVQTHVHVLGMVQKGKKLGTTQVQEKGHSRAFGHVRNVALATKSLYS
ncbi:hypothetical protein Trydic_g37 [Trypoxylus dichotomus]